MCRVMYVCPLSRQQLKLLEAMGRYGTYKSAAQALGISPHTAKNHGYNIAHKLGVYSITSAVVYAVERGWIRGITTRHQGTPGGGISDGSKYP